MLRDLPDRKQALEKFLFKKPKTNRFQINALNEDSMSKDGANSLTFYICKRFLFISICHYSLGSPDTEILKNLDLCIDWYTKLDSGYSRPVDKEDYFFHLQLIALSILLEIDENKWQALIEKWLRFEVSDRLIDLLITSRKPVHPIADSYLFEKPYAQAAAIFEMPDPKSALSELGKYLKGWYGSHRSCHWYDGHKAGGPAYFGYWSFEAAAIAKIKQLPLENSRLGQYFPYSFFNLPEQLKLEKKSTPKARKGYQRIHYPKLNALSFEIPENWKNESKERLGVLSENGLLEGAGTVYHAPDKNLQTFTEIRLEPIQKKMSWYTPIGKLENLQVGEYKALQQAYEGVWPNEKEPTYYLVTTFQFGK